MVFLKLMFTKFHTKEIIQAWVLKSKYYWFLRHYADRKDTKYSMIDTWREDDNTEMFKEAGDSFRD